LQLANVPADPPILKSSQTPSALVTEYRDEPTSTSRLKESDDNVPRIQRDKTRTSLSSYLKAAASSSKRSFSRNRSRCEIAIDSDSSDDDVRKLSSRTQSRNDQKFESQIVTGNAFNDDIPDLAKRRNRKNLDSDQPRLSRSDSKSVVDALVIEDEIVDDDDWLIPDDVNNYTQPTKKHKRTQLKLIEPSLADWGHSDFQTDQSAPVIHEASQVVSVKQQPTAFRLRVKINDQAFMVVVSGR